METGAGSGEGRPTRVEIAPDAFAHNLSRAAHLAGDGAAVMAVVKADAYGHGASSLAKVAVESGCPLLGVATVDEGRRLRADGIGGDILVLGGVHPGEEAAALADRLSATVSDLAGMRRLQAAGRSAGLDFPIHLKIDTGMARLGFMPNDVPGALEVLRGCDRLRLDGCMTHYARADEGDPSPTEEQDRLFVAALECLDRRGIRPRWIHARNSAALLNRRGFRGTLARPGIMLYGALPDGGMGRPADAGLRPVMRFRTAISLLKRIPAGWRVSYGGTFTAARPTLLAVLPVGYADGFMRYNAGGTVLVGGVRVPLAGRICMDLCMADVSDLGRVAVGDEAVLLGRQGDEAIEAGEVARRGGTIPYEVFCSVTGRVARVPGEAVGP
jgi:alanine racemase